MADSFSPASRSHECSVAAESDDDMAAGEGTSSGRHAQTYNTRFDKRQSFKKGLHGWTRGQSKTMKLEV